MLSRDQQMQLVDRIDRLQTRASTAATRAREDAASYMEIGLSGATAAALGAMAAYRQTSELITGTGVTVEASVAAAAIGYALLGGGSKRTRDYVRAVGAGALSCYLYQQGAVYTSRYIGMKKPPAKSAGMIGGMIGAADDDLLNLAAMAAR